MNDAIKMGRPKVEPEKKKKIRSIALSKEEIEFIDSQEERGSVYVRNLIRKAMKEAGYNDYN